MRATSRVPKIARPKKVPAIFKAQNAKVLDLITDLLSARPDIEAAQQNIRDTRRALDDIGIELDARAAHLKAREAEIALRENLDQERRRALQERVNAPGHLHSIAGLKLGVTIEVSVVSNGFITTAKAPDGRTVGVSVSPIVEHLRDVVANWALHRDLVAFEERRAALAQASPAEKAADQVAERAGRREATIEETAERDAARLKAAREATGEDFPQIAGTTPPLRDDA